MTTSLHFYSLLSHPLKTPNISRDVTEQTSVTVKNKVQKLQNPEIIRVLQKTLALANKVIADHEAKIISQASEIERLKAEIELLRTSVTKNSIQQVTETNGHSSPELRSTMSAKPDMPLQPLRDEVRAMVAAGKPLNEIPLYRGRPMDGDSVSFLKKHYVRYLPGDGNDTLFMNDLRYIDGRLARSIENDSRGQSLPIGTRSNLMDSLLQGKFLDGPKEVTEKRKKNAKRLRTIRS